MKKIFWLAVVPLLIAIALAKPAMLPPLLFICVVLFLCWQGVLAILDGSAFAPRKRVNTSLWNSKWEPKEGHESLEDYYTSSHMYDRLVMPVKGNDYYWNQFVFGDDDEKSGELDADWLKNR